MKTRNRFAAYFAMIAVMASAALTSALAEPVEWLTNYHTALRVAAKEGKPVLINFTDSANSKWCKRMKREIFDKYEFRPYANEHLILLEIDFANSDEGNDWSQDQNNSLNRQYEVGYNNVPTLILADSYGKELNRHSGYLKGGFKAFKKWIEEKTE